MVLVTLDCNIFVYLFVVCFLFCGFFFFFSFDRFWDMVELWFFDVVF
jgi:hypothetical protein